MMRPHINLHHPLDLHWFNCLYGYYFREESTDRTFLPTFRLGPNGAETNDLCEAESPCVPMCPFHSAEGGFSCNQLLTSRLLLKNLRLSNSIALFVDKLTITMHAFPDEINANTIPICHMSVDEDAQDSSENDSDKVQNGKCAAITSEPIEKKKCRTN